MARIYEHETLDFSSVSIGGSGDTYQAKPSIEFLEGYSFDSGYLSPYFAQGEEKDLIYGGADQIRNRLGSDPNRLQTGAYLFLTDSVVESQQDLLRVMEFGRKVRKPILVIAPDFKSEALTSMVVNHLKEVVKMVAIKTPITVDDF